MLELTLWSYLNVPGIQLALEGPSLLKIITGVILLAIMTVCNTMCYGEHQ